MGGSIHGGIFHAAREFFMKRAPVFPALFKKGQKLNKKKQVFRL